MGRTSNAKERLLQVAFDLIWEQSYGAVSVDDICVRAKVKKGSFYYFFKTKTDLVVAAYEEHWRIKLPDYERIFSKENPPLKRLAIWCDYVRSVQRTLDSDSVGGRVPIMTIFTAPRTVEAPRFA